MPNSLSLPTRVSQQVHTLARQQNQPLCAYLYDLNALEEHIKQLRHVLPKMSSYFTQPKPIHRALFLKRSRRMSMVLKRRLAGS